MKYKCRSANDFKILNEVALLKVYFQHNFDDINKDSIVVDFGGQAGSFAIYTAYTTGATVYTFEPEKENYQLLLENIRLNGLEGRIIATNKAISLTDSPRTFYLSPDENKGVHSFYYKGEHTVIVECIRLDQVLDLIGNRSIHLLKMDTEGEEHELVTLEQQAFFQRVRNLVMEYHCSCIVENHRSLENLIDTIRQIGFYVEADGDPETGIIYASQNQMDDIARVKMELHPCTQ
jgi:FkbM family methyltransferase